MTAKGAELLREELQYLKTVKISLKPDLLSICKFALLLKGSRTPFNDLDLFNISSDLYPLDNLYSK